MSAVPEANAVVAPKPKRKRTHPWRVHAPPAPPRIDRSSWMDIIRR